MTLSRTKPPELAPATSRSGWGFLFQQQRLKLPLTAAAYRRARDSGTGFVRCARPRLSARIPLSTHGPAAGVLFVAELYQS